MTIKTIPFDRRKECSKWKEIEQESKVPVEIFFSDLGALGQRRLNENSNRIVRQDLPIDSLTKKGNNIAIESLRHVEQS